MNDAIDLMEERLSMAAKRVEKFQDGHSHEDMADAFERSYDTAIDVAEHAIIMLKELLNVQDKTQPKKTV